MIIKINSHKGNYSNLKKITSLSSNHGNYNIQRIMIMITTVTDEGVKVVIMIAITIGIIEFIKEKKRWILENEYLIELDT